VYLDDININFHKPKTL